MSNTFTNKILLGDAEENLRTLPDQSVHCCVTSPPYYGLRDYGVEGQIGLEETPEKYIERMVVVFREVKRVLRDDGTLWLNIGDSYASYSTGGNGATGGRDKSTIASQMPPIGTTPVKRNMPVGCKQKDLIGIPWMLAFALRADGWYLRQDIIWHKPNPMPESVTDRCTKSHEYIFLLSKSDRYYYSQDAIKVPLTDESIQRLSQDVESQKGSDRVPGKTNGNMKAVGAVVGGNKHKNLQEKGQKNHTFHETRNRKGEPWIPTGMANRKSVWTITTKPFPDAHFATFPTEIPEICIKAGSPVGGTVLDPFMGAGTTALVARKLDRNFIGIELNSEYIKIAERRLRKELGMFL